jgi:hypothetical protein
MENGGAEDLCLVRRPNDLASAVFLTLHKLFELYDLHFISAKIIITLIFIISENFSYSRIV